MHDLKKTERESLKRYLHSRRSVHLGVSMLGTGMVSLLSGVTRSSQRSCAATTTWALRASAHLPLPLSDGDVVVGFLLSNLFPFTSHLRGYGIDE
jgi:hypothetical protein